MTGEQLSKDFRVETCDPLNTKSEVSSSSIQLDQRQRSDIFKDSQQKNTTGKEEKYASMHMSVYLYIQHCWAADAPNTKVDIAAQLNQRIQLMQCLLSIFYLRLKAAKLGSLVSLIVSQSCAQSEI